MIRFSLGHYRCGILNFGQFDMSAAVLFTEAPAVELAAASRVTKSSNAPELPA
jgi:hypothetical protein